MKTTHLLAIISVSTIFAINQPVCGQSRVEPDRMATRPSILREVVEVAQLTPSDAEHYLGDGFATSAAMDGDWIAVGAPGDDEVESDAGAVYVYRRAGTEWIEHEKIIPSDGSWEGRFGKTLAMHGDRLIVGSSANGSTEEGARLGYVYVRNDNGTPRDLSDDQWVEEQKLLIPWGALPFWLCCDGVTNIGISGNRIVAGAGRETVGFVGFVADFQYVGSSWIFVGHILNSDAEPGDYFGATVSTNGNRIAVSAPGARAGLGEVYIFRLGRNGWAEEAKLSELAPIKLLSHISMDKNSIAVGTSTAEGNGVSIYRRMGRRWFEEAFIPAPHFGKPFGDSIYLTEDNLFVWSRTPENDFPILYNYGREGRLWQVQQVLMAADTTATSGFGGVRTRSGRFLVTGGRQKAYVLQFTR